MHPTKHIKEGDVLIAKEGFPDLQSEFTPGKDYTVLLESFYLKCDKGHAVSLIKSDLLKYFSLPSPSEEVELPTDKKIGELAKEYSRYGDTKNYREGCEDGYFDGFQAALKLIKSQYNLIKK